MFKINRYFIISLTLAVVICGLEAFDVPAYVSCKHIGVCEFLDVPGIKIDSAEPQMITTYWQSGGINGWHLPKGWPDHLPVARLSAIRTQHRSDLREYFFSIYICQIHQRQGLDLDTKWVKIIIINYTNYILYSKYAKDSKLTSQVLRTLASSVIRC
jgi:hypothetical protein